MSKRTFKKNLGFEKYYYIKPNHERMNLKIKIEKIIHMSIHPAFCFLSTLHDKKDNLYLYPYKSDLR